VSRVSLIAITSVSHGSVNIIYYETKINKTILENILSHKDSGTLVYGYNTGKFVKSVTVFFDR